ncbi:MAG: class I SAM-dependent methyltransferase [Phyllobacterium sp.]|uniref:class I SAM-dependent methyltransferase n=1 Tax=Phyllobacterium sp. TaxID=1871046 RepID=UPI0030F33C2E
MSEQEHWQLDGSAPELYERYLVPAITSVWAADLIDRARPKPGEAALDIACGTGAVTRLAAERMASGRVVGVDFNPGMLAVARSVPNSGASIEWLEGNALGLPFDDGTFDLVLCQLGLQFFPDRPLALREMKRVLAPSGRVALSVYSAIENTPAANAFVQALDQSLGPDASRIKRAEHIFPQADEVGALMTQEGFDQVDVKTVTKRITFPSVLDYVQFQFIATPMAGLLGDRNDVERETIISNVASATQSLLDPEMLRDGHLSFPQEAHVATALRVG